MGKYFRAFIPELPPSTNKMHAVVQGHLVLTRAAREYKARSYEALKEFEHRQFSPDIALELDITFHLPKLTNKGWPGKAKRKYKKRDVTNMLKLIEDVVALYLEIDDSQFLDVIARKREGKEGVSITVTYV